MAAAAAGSDSPRGAAKYGELLITAYVSNTMRIWPGSPYPLGATWDGMGVNFSLFSENAEKVELCLFDSARSRRESVRIPMPEYTDQVWHVYLPDIRPGQLYSYRVYGPWDPKHGQRFNPNKLVLDPYAKAVVRGVKWHDAMFGYRIGGKKEDLGFDRRNNASYAPLAAVIDSAFTWGGDQPPKIPWHKTVIYEAHVKGMTMLHPEVPPELRGTYMGLATEPVVQHLRRLGVTAIELMPIHRKVDDRHLEDRGLSNYWGYNTLGFFAPESRYSNAPDPLGHVNEFKTLVRTMHANGIEVILDVVYNHTAEGNHLGPTLSFRGIDNQSYYRLVDGSERYYQDFTGCGNSLNMLHPRVLQLIMDSLRYWVTEMHVDGFRFDLASALARELHEVNQLSTFFGIIHQDPILSQVKLIAEPWDLGEGGYQVGNFPVLWTEWNGKFRDTMRGYWKGDHGLLPEVATRIAGSSDLYGGERKPYASINFITCHDGFTLQDLVSYNEKHNEANGEYNRDGCENNLSWNCGAEGPTDNPEINKLRSRQKRNLLASLFFSAGVPMLSGGDELSRSQHGNNNSYCQDSELSWYHWELSQEQEQFLEFTQYIIELRKSLPLFLRRSFFADRADEETGIREATWYAPDGSEMEEKTWGDYYARSLAVCLSGDTLAEMDERGRPVRSETVLLLLNAHHEVLEFVLPQYRDFPSWTLCLETADANLMGIGTEVRAGESYSLIGRSLALFSTSSGHPRHRRIETLKAEVQSKRT